jgi:hypothetical protein
VLVVNLRGMTNLGVYLRDTGTSQVWLAEAVGVCNSTVNNWAIGHTRMSRRHQAKVLAVLEQRAALSLDDLCADQGAPCDWDTGGTPFDQFCRARANPPGAR